MSFLSFICQAFFSRNSSHLLCFTSTASFSFPLSLLTCLPLKMICIWYSLFCTISCFPRLIVSSGVFFSFVVSLEFFFMFHFRKFMNRTEVFF
ncbi:unnamed protein product, partial [Cylicocyclus nassatus]